MVKHLWIVMSVLVASATLGAQDKSADAKAADRPGLQYSGMYSFLKEGEFVQVTVEDAGRVTGFVSRFGDLDSD
jgi:hypothetical protein